MEDQEQIVLCNLTEKESVSTQIHQNTFPSLDQVEDIISYKFNNKGLLEEAFTHPSYCEKLSYERLEYVGDSVLNLLFTKEQYFMYPDLPPGSLTLLRSANVDTEKLARVAIKLGLHKFLRHKKPLLEEQVSDKNIWTLQSSFIGDYYDEWIYLWYVSQIRQFCGLWY